MSKYYLPYNFIPVTGKVNGEKVNAKEWKKDKQTTESQAVREARHDIYKEGSLTGVITCLVTIKTPVIVGNMHDKGANETIPTVINNYQVDGKPALPGNSLRGMISSVCEAISQSALRVLDNHSWRFFKATKVDNEVVDLTPFNVARESLTPAELLFGVSALNEDENGKIPQKNNQHRSLQSRVFFSDALLVEGQENVLHEMLEVAAPSSPQMKYGEEQKGKHSEKVPNPYFHKKRYPYDGSPFNFSEYQVQREVIESLMSEEDKSSVPEVYPNGRKKYLLQSQKTYEYLKRGKEINSFANKKNIIRFKPLKEKTEFQFFVKFENLTVEEFGLLRTAISPDASFRHSLGLYKNNGFGQISVSIDSVKTKDIKSSYNSLTNSIYQEYDQQVSTALVDEDSLDIIKKIGVSLMTDVRWRYGHRKEKPFVLAPPLASFLPFQETEAVRPEYAAIRKKIKEIKKKPTKYNEVISVDESDRFMSALNNIPTLKGKLKHQLGQNEITKITNFLNMNKTSDDYFIIINGVKSEMKKGNDSIFAKSAIKTLKKKSLFKD